MNKVKAIKVLKPLVDSYVDYANISMKEEDDDIVDALEMAIEALKALDVPDMNVGDMIIRQAAIDALDCISGVEEVLRSLSSAQPEPKWIPCSERLPEERGFYLTTTKDKAVYCDHWNEDNFDRTEMVIAWMPLPEPYEGGDSE